MKYIATLFLSLTVQGAFAQQCFKCAATFSDPHIQTFQRSRYQCQGEGDFVMAKSQNSDFELQARFQTPTVPLWGGRDGSTTVGAVYSTGVGNEAKVELAVTPAGKPASSIHDCDIHYKINGEETTFNSFDVRDNDNRFYFARRTVEDHGFSYSFRQFHFYDSNTILWASKAYDQVFGCYMNMQLCVPCDFDDTHEVFGLFGSPNGLNYMDRDNNAMSYPSKGSGYCADNWCVGDKTNSLFDVPSEYNQCTADTTTDFDELVEDAHEDVKKQCQGNVNCIVDAELTGDIDIGLKTLEEEKEKGFFDEHDGPDPTASDVAEEDDSYTCTKAGVGSETAFARPDDGSNCFLDDGFSRWGWSLEIEGLQSGSYEYDVYAGAGQCDTSKGDLVGKVIVSYDMMNQECTGEYISVGGHTVQEFQFYCGSDPHPRTNNDAKALTVAPGQYDCKHLETMTSTSDTCVVEGVQPKNGVIHAIAHAVSCDAPPTSSPTDAPTGTPTPAPTDATRTEEVAGRNFNAPAKKGSSSGDPHFKTWTGDKYDYHGECDLVLVDHPEFADALGLRVHIRTTRVKYFSFIEKVALQIGDNVLEFDNDVENFLINGEQVEANRQHHKTMLGDYIVRRDKKAISVRLDDEGKAKIDFHTRKNGFPAVIVDGGHTDIFDGSLGLLGDFHTGKKLARDGTTEIEADSDDATPFALEWQVRDTEPTLFKESRFPQFPTVCTPPAKWAGFRLGHKNMQKEAEEACSHWKHDKEDCIFDVMATRDILVAEEGHIVHVE